jgi:hypothetical protein
MVWGVFQKQNAAHVQFCKTPPFFFLFSHDTHEYLPGTWGKKEKQAG